MKQKSIALLLGLMILGTTCSVAQTLSVNSSDYSQATYSFTTVLPTISTIQTEGGSYSVINLANSAPSTHIGRPNLPIVTQMVEIPLCENVTVEVSQVRTRNIKSLSHPVIPVQPAPSKADREALPWAMDSAYYALNAFNDGPTAWVERLGIGRDRNLALLRISPLRYNPATGEMNLITDMTITLTYHNADIAATTAMHSRYHSPDFAIGNGALNTLPDSKSIRDDAPLHYLIVAHSSFRGALDNFIAWKKRQGFLVTVGYTNDPSVGTSSTSIASYIKSFYTNATDDLPAPTYLLLVGDHQQIPAFDSRCSNPANDHVTDLYYVTWTDGDNIPDCYQGRFSAQNLSELTPQIEKTILYENYAFDNDSYLANSVLIAGVDRGYNGDNAYNYADPAMDYIAKTYINASNGYNNVHYYKNNINFAPDGVHVEGSSQTTGASNSLRTLYNSGCGWVNYSAHGYDDEWSIPNFNTSAVASMTNNGMPSVMIGNCCLSGKFNTTYSDACLGEALLRKNNNAGAVTYIGATNSTYWPHDFCWAVGVRSNITNTMNANYDASHLGMYDRLFHTHNEAHSAWHTTAGSINVAGNNAVEMYGSYTLYYWEIYELFGDPSLMPWLGQAADITLEYQSVIPVGSATYTVQTAPYAYVAITTPDEHQLMAAAYANASGEANINLPPDLLPGTYELVAWAQNRKPIFEEITVAVLDGPYVMLTQIEPAEQPHPGQMNYFNLTITNIGNTIPTTGLITLSCDNPLATIVQPVAHFTRCNPGDTILLPAMCPVYLSDSLEDGATLTFTAQVDFGAGNSTRRKNIQVSAPRISVSNAKASPQLTANAPSTITCRISNIGTSPSQPMTLTLRNDYGFISQHPDPVQLDTLDPGQSLTVSFYTALDSFAPNAVIPFYLYATTPQGTQLLETLHLSCGINHTEDFETGDFTRHPWTFNSHPWEITTSNTFEGTYSARSMTNLPRSSESRLNISWNNLEDDSISFYYKVSSEEGYDLFRFYLDGSEKISSSGEVDWQRASFLIPAGNHILTFSYSKDRNGTSGSDCAWIDNIRLPFTGQRPIFTLDQVCKNTPYQFADQTISTATTGTYSFVDTSSSPWQYLSLSVLDEPQITIERISNNYSDQCLLLKAHGAEQYIWNTGDTAQCIAVCPTERTTYTVVGYRGQCSGQASTTLLSITPNADQTHVSLYPNPTHSTVTVAASQMRSVTLLNVMGQALIHQPTHSDTTTLDLQKMPNGIYFIRIETPDSYLTRKLIKK